MFGSEVLEVVIGISFVYLMLSFVCSAVQEMIAAALQLRAQYLYRGIRTLLDDPPGIGLVRDFFSHSLINTLYRGNYEPGRHSNLPSYIPARAFALAIMDLAVPRSPYGDVSGAAATTVAPQASSSTGIASGGPQRLRETLTRTSLPPTVGQALLILTDAAGSDAIGTRENIEQWYNNAMERVSSAYKQRTQVIIMIIGVVVAAAVNADSIGIVTTLSTNKAVHESLNGALAIASDATTLAESRELRQIPACKADANSPDCRLELHLNRIRNSGLPLGWVQNAAPGDFRGIPGSLWQWIQKSIGILLTIAAISLGAPFCFDVLNKIAVIRSAIKPFENGDVWTTPGISVLSRGRDDSSR